ncbi:hypothetical protein BGZ97_012360 [Linnemannia gamsii]|uniref:Uncharacterized protein n=1 Tax=Linnemannia gamsii TaxID=64522 RepID=A0A9P6RLV3_9FUNG|nr:hypothetical protein BGZ97_012360 [Linnemannia gamsii]
MASVTAGSRSGSNAIAKTDQQRAIAEVQAAMMIARMNPRDPIVAMDRILNACTRPSLADAAVYTYAKGGSNISGPSIRLAEAMAQAWGNLQFGIRELDQANGESTVQAYAWDVETNTRKEITFQVPHLHYTRKGSYKLEDPSEIYKLTANQAARRLRTCILTIIPGDVTEAAVTQCEKTMRIKADTSPEAMQKMVSAFESFSVTKEQIEKRIQRRLDAIQPAQVVSLKKIYASLRDGMSTPADWFEAAEAEATSQATTASRTDAVKAKAQAQREAARKKSETDQQDDALRQLEQDSQQQSFGATFAQVSDQLHKASDIDLLEAAIDLLDEVNNPAHREELSAIYRQRRAELEQS